MYTQLQLRDSTRPPVNVATLHRMKEQGEKISSITCYDASYAALVDASGADVVLVGDSLGMVIQGHDTTVPVTLEHIIYHCRAVCEGPAPPVPDGRHAVHDLHLEGNGARQCRAPDAGGRGQDGQARRRREPGADRRIPREPRHRRLCAPRAAAAIGAQDRRLSRAGPRGGGGRADARRTPRRCRTPAPTSCCSNAFRPRSARRSPPSCTCR